MDLIELRMPYSTSTSAEDDVWKKQKVHYDLESNIWLVIN